MTKFKVPQAERLNLTEKTGTRPHGGTRETLGGGPYRHYLKSKRKRGLLRAYNRGGIEAIVSPRTFIENEGNLIHIKVLHKDIYARDDIVYVLGILE